MPIWTHICVDFGQSTTIFIACFKKFPKYCTRPSTTYFPSSNSQAGKNVQTSGYQAETVIDAIITLI